MYYSIAKHIHLCSTANGVVIFDLLKDKYQCVSGQGADIINELISSNGGLACDAVSVSQQKLVQALIQQGWLVQTQEAELRKFGQVPECNAQIHFSEQLKPTSVTASVQALCAMTIAHFELKHRPIHRLVQSLQNKKSNCKNQNTTSDQLTQLVYLFKQTRPLFPRSKICLFDSYALLKFLSYYQIYPDWVFAILSMPFAAHCWLQHDGRVLNDSLDVIRPYQPIFVV